MSRMACRDDVEVVEQPLGGGRRRLAAPGILGQRGVDLAQARGRARRAARRCARPPPRRRRASVSRAASRRACSSSGSMPSSSTPAAGGRTAAVSLTAAIVHLERFVPSRSTARTQRSRTAQLAFRRRYNRSDGASSGAGRRRPGFDVGHVSGRGRPFVLFFLSGKDPDPARRCAGDSRVSPAASIAGSVDRGDCFAVERSRRLEAPPVPYRRRGTNRFPIRCGSVRSPTKCVCICPI